MICVFKEVVIQGKRKWDHFMNGDEKAALAQEMLQAFQMFRKHKIQNEEPGDIRPSEFFLLSALNSLEGQETKGVKASELSTQLRVTPAAATHMLNSLEGVGYIARMADPTDRRIVLVGLTEKGKQYCLAKEKRMLGQFEAFVEFLGERDTRELLRISAAAYTFFKERRKENEDKLKT